MGSAESRPGSEAQLAAVARRFGTPLYVMDASALAQAAEQVERAFPAPWVLHYSLKANDLPAVTALLAERGWGANVVSVGEWELARAAGVAAGRTTVEGIGKTDADLAAVVDSAAEGRGVRWVSVESRGELARLTELVSHRDSTLIALHPDRGMHRVYAFLGDDGAGRAGYLHTGRALVRAAD